MKKIDFANWKTEVLTSKQLALLANSTESAIQQYFQSKFEDSICVLIKAVVEKDVLYSFGDQSFKILEYYDQEAAKYISSLKKESISKIIQTLAKIYLNPEKISTDTKISRELGA